MNRERVLASLRDVRKTYWMGENPVHALRGVSLDLHHGELVTVVGPSGSGKSTLMHILGCLDRVSEGAYHLDGRDLSRAGDVELSTLRNTRIGFVFQQFNLLHNLTVEENIALPLSYAGLPRGVRLERAQRIGERLGLGDRLTHRPFELSGGQAQRVAIARALINDPPFILADEPTGALDTQTGREIMGLFHELHEEGRTILIVTHDPEIAALGTRTLHLRDGRISRDESGVEPAPPRDRAPVASGTVPALGLRDLVRMGIREGLLAHKLRTALTMLGVVIGVASVIGMSSVSEGSKKKQADQIRAMGANLIRVVDTRPENQELIQARVAGSPGLTREDAEVIRASVEEVNTLATARQIRMRAAVGPRTLEARILGVAGDYLAVNNLELASGRFFSPEDHHTLRRVAVIGSAIAEALDVHPAEGATLELGGQPFTVIGVIANKYVDTTSLEASGANDANRDILIPLETLVNRTTYLPLRNPVDEIQIQVRDEEELTRAGISIRRLLQAAHQGVEDFQLIIPLDLLKTRQQSQRLLDVLSLCISAISLVVGGIGIMNIMLASVTERLREIGIRRAVGATQLNIRRQFLVEAVMIAGVGGLIGVLLAVLIVIGAALPMQLPVVFQPLVMAVAVSAAFVTGLVFGYYPAAKAAAQNLVEILQHE